MKVDFDDVNFEELARCTDDMNGAQLKAVAVESGMIALRRDAKIIKHEGATHSISIYFILLFNFQNYINIDFMEAINVVQSKKKGILDYYA